MRRSLTLVLALLTLSVMMATVAQAEPRRTRAIQRRTAESRAIDARTPALGAEVPNGNRSTGYAGRYPKFQGGFHSRQLQDIGVPTGDQGLRGNGFQMYPW